MRGSRVVEAERQPRIMDRRKRVRERHGIFLTGHSCTGPVLSFFSSGYDISWSSCAKTICSSLIHHTTLAENRKGRSLCGLVWAIRQHKERQRSTCAGVSHLESGRNGHVHNAQQCTHWPWSLQQVPSSITRPVTARHWEHAKAGLPIKLPDTSHKSKYFFIPALLPGRNASLRVPCRHR